MVGRRLIIVLLSVVLFISVTAAGSKSKRHSSAHYNNGHSRTANGKSSTSPREIFDRFQDITAENCQDADPEDQTIDIQLDYGRWKSPTNLALFVANLYTTKLQQLGGSLESFSDSSILSSVQSLVASGRPLVFGSGAFFEPGIFQRHSEQFQAYAFLKDGTISAFNTAVNYDFRENESYQKMAGSDWTTVKEEDFVTTESGTSSTLNVLSATFEDGVWTKPYFDCGGGNVWMVSYLAPIFNRAGNGRVAFVGVGTIDISLDGLDINQCDDNEGPADAFLDAFRGTHRCPSGSKCVFKSGFGFRPGGYECVADNGCVLQGRDLEQASGRKLRKLLQRCRRYGHKSRSNGKRSKRAY